MWYNGSVAAGWPQERGIREYERGYHNSGTVKGFTGGAAFEAGKVLWGDIDYKQNVIHVTKTVTFNEDSTMGIGSPKSEGGKRDIPLNDTIKGVLSDQGKKLGNVLPMNGNRIFISIYGAIVHNHALNRAISGALGRLEEQGRPIGHFTAHALRDTFAIRKWIISK